MTRVLIVLPLLLGIVLTLPYNDKIALANSLVVGRADKAWQCKICDESNKPLTSHYIHHTVKDIKCIISVYKDFAVLGFRYTNSLKNVWQDILYPFQVVDEGTCKKCKVQKVYHNMWNSLRYNITVDLMKINSENKIDTLYITGISLGGGLAVISFVDIFNDKLFKNLHVVVFGSPKVGNKHWADWYDQKTNKSTLRYQLKGDPITLLPECFTPLCNYKHVGHKVVCYSDTKTCEVQKQTNDQTPIVQVTQIDEDIQHMGAFMDHVVGYPKIYEYKYLINPPKRKPKSKPAPTPKPKPTQTQTSASTSTSTSTATIQTQPKTQLTQNIKISIQAPKLLSSIVPKPKQ